MNKYYPYGIPEPYSILDYSYGKYYTDEYEEAKNNVALVKSWLSSGDLSLALINARNQTGNWLTDVGLGISNWLFSPEPSFSDLKILEESSKAH